MKKEKFLEIVRFGASGGIGVIVGYTTLYILTEYIGLWYLWSSMISCFLSYVVGFFMQKFWTFQNKETRELKKQFFVYIIISVLFFITNTGFMYIFVTCLHIQYILSQVILTIVLSVISYFTSKKIFAQKSSI